MPALAVLRHPLFVGCVVLYGAYQLNHHWLHRPLPPQLTSYLRDVLCMPVMLSIALVAHQLVYGRQATLPASWVLAASAFVALWFEVLLPRWAPHAVADPWDVLAYAAGALIFQRWLNK
jgi:hypothetical protein